MTGRKYNKGLTVAIISEETLNNIFLFTYLHFQKYIYFQCFGNKHTLSWGFSDGSRSKESTCNAGISGAAGLISGSERSPGGGNGNPLQHSCLEKPHGQRSLVGYSPKCHEESVTTEWLNTHTHTHTHTGVSSQWSWQQLWALQLRTEPVVLFSRADILYIINDQVWTYEMRSMK